MFERFRSEGTPGRSIALQTKTGRDILNELGIELTETHRQRFEILLSAHPHWQARKPPTGGYNCAGHVWASRRTCIYEETEWRKILIDDGYRHTTRPMPDDLVIYLNDGSDILHIGRVVHLKEGIAKGREPIPWVVSKWADSTGEVCHACHDFPSAWHVIGFHVSFEFWTDRPKTRGISRDGYSDLS